MGDSLKTLLLVTIFLPLAGAGLMWVVAPLGRRYVRATALIVSLITLALAMILIAYFPADGVLEGGDSLAPGQFALTDADWLGSATGIDVRFSVDLDGLSLWLFGLSALLIVSSVLVSWRAIRRSEALFYGMLLLLECGCLGVFAARDIILFYVFFEFTLIPLFFLIGIWGSEERRWAAIKFFLFTLAGSVLTFLGLLTIVLWVYLQSGGGDPTAGAMTFSIAELTESLAHHPMSPQLQLWVFLALFAGFAIKVPLFPLHTWLPLAHVQAPTAGSVILAGILLKIGTYGFLRFNIPMLPDATARLMPWLLWLAVAGIIYGALVALAQKDIKRLIAYSSVSHLGFCMLGLFALNRVGSQGAVLQMINHGIATGGLFAVVGMIYERYHTREIKDLGGLARRAPILAFFMLAFTLSSIGLPGTGGFTGEIMIVVGMFQRAWEAGAPPGIELKAISIIALSGVVLGAWYMLYLVQRVFFGPLKEPDVHTEADEDVPPADLSLRETAALAPLVVFVVWIGIMPQFFLSRIGPTVIKATRQAEERLEDRLEEMSASPAQAALRTEPSTIKK